MKPKILVIGAAGQIGIELVRSLRLKHGETSVIASDLRCPDIYSSDEYFVPLDVLDDSALRHLIIDQNITEVYLLAAVLSAKGEENPLFAWNLNMQSLLNLLEIAKDQLIDKLFWPSSIAVFGSLSPQFNTPQNCVKNPNTVYGISKLSGEQWCAYYHEKYDVDVRSLRYPGLIGHESQPGGGTTDYAVSIFYDAIRNNQYNCYLSEDRSLPMMYMEDAISATIKLMEADSDTIKVRDSYNLAGISFSPKDLANEIVKHIENFRIQYEPDFRDIIAASWPNSIDDSVAKKTGIGMRSTISNQWSWTCYLILKEK